MAADDLAEAEWRIVVPSDLCPAHHRIASDWRDNEFNLWDPGDWPAGVRAGASRTNVMDNRTTSDERLRWFEEKNRAQVALVIEICRSGRSPQCTETWEAP